MALVRGQAELHSLVGDPSKARDQLGSESSIDFQGLIHICWWTRISSASARSEQAWARSGLIADMSLARPRPSSSTSFCATHPSSASDST